MPTCGFPLDSSLELFLFFGNLLSDVSVILTDLVVELIQVSLYEHLNVRVLELARAAVFVSIGASIEVHAIWKELVEELGLDFSHFILRDIFALFENLFRRNLCAA